MPEAQGVVPDLRFPEFRDAGPWEVKRLGDVCDVLDNMRKPVTSTKRKPGPYAYYGASGAIDYIDQFIFEERLLLIGEDGAKWGPFEKTAFIVEGKYWVNNHAHVLRPTQLNDVLLENFLNATDISVYVTGAAPSKLTLDNLKAIRVPVPPTSGEQQKIADCLSSLDDLIRAEEGRLAALRAHKTGLMQRLFPAPGQTAPRLRFPEFRDAGPWEVKLLGEIAITVKERNNDGQENRVLTNSAEFGVVDQRAFFNKDIAVKENLEGYTIVEEDDFVYNPRISATAPVGPISRNKVSRGVMSPLYTVFRFQRGCLDFFEYFFQSSAWHPYLRTVGSTGARHDRLSVSIGDFLDMPIFFPSQREQQKIADCLTALDDLIRAQGETIAALKAHKTALMQKLFPREVG